MPRTAVEGGPVLHLLMPIAIKHLILEELEVMYHPWSFASDQLTNLYLGPPRPHQHRSQVAMTCQVVRCILPSSRWIYQGYL